MAGIVGIAQQGKRKLVEEMLERIAHRGPAGRSIIDTPQGTLGVVWPEAQLEDGKKTWGRPIVWDGRFSGDLRLAEQDSPLALAAFTKKGLFLIRDGLGISPLYYGETDGALIFASEVKALVGLAERIEEFPPGYKYTSSRGLERFFRLKVVTPESLTPEEAANRLRCSLARAVEELIDGENVGSWLSGGLDSSTLAALARPHVDKLHTFAVGLEGADDLQYAKIVAEHIGSEHHERVFTIEDLLAVLPEVIFHLESFDALLVRSALTNYLVAEMTADYVPVVLSGEGGDELFAGYEYVKKIPPEKLSAELIASTNRLHNTALQRVDRSATAYGMVAHVGFLVPEVVDLAIRIPQEYKLYRNENEPIEKWILRLAVEDLLPEEVLWRPKVKFWEGAGVEDLLALYAEEKISDSEFARERLLPDGTLLRTKEELWYYRIFKEYFGELDDYSFVGRTKGAPEV